VARLQGEAERASGGHSSFALETGPEHAQKDRPRRAPSRVREPAPA
jgi:hypothetical protein